MKKMSSMFALLFALASPLAQAANEGPVGAPPNFPSARVIAQLSVRGGFAPPPGINNGIRIYSNGLVETYTHQVVTPLATLEPALTARLIAEIDGVTDLELRDHQAGAPMCTDTPVVTHAVFPASGETIQIFRTFGCHQFSRQDGFGYHIRRLLDGFAGL